MSTWKATFAVLVIFVLGTIFGLAVSHWIAPGSGARGLPAQEIVTQRSNQCLARNLSLSAEQEQAIAGIVEEARNQLAEIRKETRPRVRQIIVNARERIRAQLNPEQRARFDKILERNRRPLDRWFSR